ncbi:nodulation protein [Archangium violaceum]|uniref:carbamoyltransferase family protein n=1 Tax=Archangium violaceum TaxID=83451 RepID=UPI00193C60B5|nr:carbamoyltransferase C-terminal domain-containing protein [Archangium violaceum]QRK11342.1 nodulation protein [Archangium violaceum]
MIVLGFNHGGVGDAETPFGHDAGAALVIGGKVVAAAEEERFARVKHTSRFPAGAITYCLETAGIGLEQVDCFCFPWNPELDRQNVARADIELSLIFNRHSLRSLVHAELFDGFRAHFGFTVPEQRRRRVPHHLAHAASTFFCSPFEQAAYLVVDAYGEMVSTSYGRGRDTHLEPMEHTLLPTSIGVLYADVTRLLGFHSREDEYKVMGLAAHGSPERFRELFRCQWRPTSTGVEQVSDERSRAAVLELTRYRRLPRTPVTAEHQDIAAALQECLEEQMLHLARVVREQTGERHLCLAGGVALNSTANGKLARSGLFEGLFIQPAANDAGTPLGAALFEAHRHSGRRKGSFSAYLGPAFPESRIDAACERRKAELVVTRPEDLLSETVRRLARGQILGWYQGRMEFGPRALGNRSILADPRKAGMKDRINHVVKHRESFRPFAPAVLAEHASEYFAMGPVAESPFMLMTVPVNPERRGSLEATVHLDGTARVQTVSAEQNPLFWRLLQRFHEETGVPALLNTSFNVNGEPIVCTPEDAIESFLSTELDALVLGDRLIERRALSLEDLLPLRPRLQEGVRLRTSLTAPGEGVVWRNTVVSRRHFQAELQEDAAALLLACDGTKTVAALLEELASGGEERSQVAASLSALLERFLRLRLICLE